MGSPKKLRSKWSRPLKPFDRVRLEAESVLKKEYGFKRKREIWKIDEYFRNLKRRARNILATHNTEDEKILMTKLARMGLGTEKSALDDVLNMTIESLCERRIQTIIFKKGFATTPNQARQLVVHRKVLIGETVLDMPNYLVNVEEEKMIRIKPGKVKPIAVEKPAEVAPEGVAQVEAEVPSKAE